MGKKSLIKSTTKKKTASPKKSASKQSAANAKTTKPVEKKAATAKKPASAAAPPKQARKKMSVSELLKLSFEPWSPDKLYAPPADASGPANYTAPPFFDATPEEAAALKSLLAMQFDLTALPVAPETLSPVAEEKPAAPADKDIKAPEEVPEATDETLEAAEAADKTPSDSTIAETPAPEPSSPDEPEAAPAPEPRPKAVPVSELLNLSFGRWSPDKLYAPPADMPGPANYTAPPFFDATPEEAAALKSLLAMQFDLTASPVAPKTPSPAAEEKPAAPADKEIKAPEEIPEAAAADETPAFTEDTALDDNVSAETPTKDETPAAAEAAAPAPVQPPAAQEPVTPEPSAPTESEAAPEPETVPETPSAEEPAFTPEPEPYIPPAPVCAAPPDAKEPPNTALRMLIGCLAVIFGLLLIASVMNSNNYYLKPTPAGLAIWRGKFSPKGKTLVETVPDFALSAPVESVYNRDQAMTVVFEYYINQAAQRSTAIGEPDFAAIEKLYEQAKTYATTPAQTQFADTRLRTIKAQSLIAAADKTIVKMTPRNIDKALALLNEAAGLATDRTQQQLIRVKIDELTAMKTEKAEKEAGAKSAGREETKAAGKSKD
jgi:hypothetical protein